MHLTPFDVLLLIIINDNPGLAGSGVATLLKEDYSELEITSGESVFISLEKLKKDQLLTSNSESLRKINKPGIDHYTISDEGFTKLKEKVQHYLGTTRENDVLFDIGILGSRLLEWDKIYSALNVRKEYLMRRFEKLKKNFAAAQDKSFYVNALMKHSLYIIEHEIKYINDLIKDVRLQKEQEQVG